MNLCGKVKFTKSKPLKHGSNAPPALVAAFESHAPMKSSKNRVCFKYFKNKKVNV